MNMGQPDGFFEYGGGLPRNEIIRQRVEALFQDNPDKVLLPVDRFGGERLHFIVETPGRTVLDPLSGESHLVPSSYTPYVAERSDTFGFSLTKDYAAQIAAGPTEADAEEAATQRARFSETFYTGGTNISPQAVLETRWNRGEENRGTETTILGLDPSDQDTLARWNDIVAAAKAYDPRTHGIVRAPSQPNGLRTGPDYLSLLAQVAEHQREVYRASLPRWRRLAGLIMPSLVTPPPFSR
jgi:hypothetical protein